MKLTTPALAALTGYIITVPAANLLVTHIGTVPVGFGLAAPAGVFTVGIALVLRDLIHEWAGHKTVWAAITIGTVLSYLLADPRLAAASAIAFGLAEMADYFIYTPLRRRGLLLALAASNLVGLAVDSLLFLQIAFGNLGFLWGQIVAKTEMTLLAALVLACLVYRRQRATPPAPAGIESCACTVVQRALCGHCRHDRCHDCGACTGAGHGVHECLVLA